MTHTERPITGHDEDEAPIFGERTHPGVVNRHPVNTRERCGAIEDVYVAQRHGGWPSPRQMRRLVKHIHRVNAQEETQNA